MSNPPLSRCAPFERFAFTHIPKTAGLTLRAILAIVCNSYGWPWEEILGSWQDGENGALSNYRSRSTAALRRARIVWGHLPYGFHGASQPHVALLRDPVERMISSYAMGLAGGSYPPGKSIADLAAEGYFDDNLQCRLLSGLPDQVRPGSVCNEEVFARALKNLQSGYVLAADTERFNDFVAVMLRLLGAPPILFFRRNVRALDLPADAVAALRRESEKLMAFDVALYQHVAGRVRAAASMLNAGPSQAIRGGLAFYDLNGGNFVRYEDNLERHVQLLSTLDVKVSRHTFDESVLEFA